MTEAFYSTSLADAATYPPPRVPLLPYLNASSFASLGSRYPIAGTRRRLTNSGRAALAQIISELELPPGARVLLPAYHCPSMVEPFRQAGATLCFYPLTPELLPVPEAFAALLKQKTAIVVFVDFFGLQPAHREALARARAAGAVIVHDCAHALYALDTVPDGDFAVASLPKFLPVEEGGILQYPGHHAPRTASTSTGIRHNLSLAARAFARRRAARQARRRARDPIPWISPPIITKGGSACHFDASRVRQRVGWWTAALLRLVGGNAAERRRDNYSALLAHTATLHGVRALYPELADSAVPYVFPVLLEHGAAQFHLLRSAGLPLYRWEQLASSSCETSRRYRETLVQLPCHQDLMPGDMATIMRALSHAAENSHGR